jgi:hypothetical protein
MKRLTSLLGTVALALVFSVPTRAGTIPVGGFCDSAACVQANQPEEGGAWRFFMDMWVVVSSVY